MKCLLIIVLITTFASCTQEIKSKKKNEIDIASNVGKTEIVNLSEISEGIEYIPLETTDKSILAPPFMYLSFENGVLYILQFDKEIKIFNYNGTFIRTFNKRGRAEQEYESLYDFSVDPITNNLFIYSFEKLSEYDENGNYIKQIKIHQQKEISIYAPSRLFRINKELNLLTFRNYKSKYSSCVTDSLFNVQYFVSYSEKEQSIRKNIKKQISFFIPYFYKYRDSVRIFNGYGENILTISNSKRIDTSFVLNYGKYDFRNADLSARNLSSMPYIKRYGDINESSNYIFMQFHLGSLPHKPRKKIKGGAAGAHGETIEEPITASIFNKATGEFKFVDQPEFNQFGFVDDFENGPAFWPLYISQDDYMVSIIEAYKFIQYAQTHKVSDKFKKIADNLKEDDNPVVVLVKLKK
ncbi:MAG: 6-bladed beta-propeller [Bacteroidales bacterium]